MLDFSNLSKYRENNRIEAKKSLGGLPESLWETYSAFANSLGGLILLGVIEHKDKSLSAVNLQSPQKLIDEFWTIINDKSRVSANVLTKNNVRIEKVNGSNIIVIDVPKARREERPIYINGNAYLGTYRRNGEGDYRCSKFEIDSMIRDKSIKSQDSVILCNMNLSSLNLTTVNKYLDCLRNSSTNKLNIKESVNQILNDLCVVELGKDKEYHPTIAGILMFGYYGEIKKVLPNYSLEIDCDFLSINGKQEMNLFDFYCFTFDIIKNNLKLNKEVNKTKILEALVEALANSIVNADYYVEGGVKITWEKQRIIFSNAGSFRLEIEKAKTGGISDPRNNLLIKMFHSISISNRSGSGIPKIFRAWKQNEFLTPKIIEEFDPDRITFILDFVSKKEKSNTNIEENIKEKKESLSSKDLRFKEIIIDYLTDNVLGDEQEISTFLGVKEEKVSLLINQLVKEDILIIEQENGRTVYKLKLKYDKN